MATKTSSSASPRRILMYVGIVVALAALLFAAFAMGDEAGPSVEEVAGSPEVAGEPLPPTEDFEDDPARGSDAPVVTGTDFDGEQVTVGDGDAEIIIFLASWCPACQAEVPELVEWLEDGNLPDGVELNAVVTGLADDRPNWPPQDWLEDEGFDQPVVVDDAESTVANAFGMTATPYWVTVHEGRVVQRVSGQLPMEVVEQLAQALVMAG